MNPRQFKDIEQTILDIEDWWRAAQNCSGNDDPNEAGKLYDKTQSLLDLLEQTTKVVH